MAAGDRFSSTQNLPEVQWCLTTLLSAGRYSARQLVFGPNPAARSGWWDDDEDLSSAQGASLPGQFVRQWKLRKMVREAAVQEVANSSLRRLLARNKSSNRTDVKVGGSVLFCEASNSESAPCLRGPAVIPDLADAGVVAKFHSQTFMAAR